jgi:putative ABC transport system substrate-binding protein
MVSERPIVAKRRTLRRRLLAVVALAPLLARAKGVKRRRLSLVGFPQMFEGDDGLDQVAKSLAGMGYVHGERIEVARVPLALERADAQRRGFDYLVPELERQLLPTKPEVIVTFGSIMTKGVHLATRTIPIVGNVSDPVAMGVANSLARPGKNVTGLAGGVAETALKATELFKAVVPKLTRLAIFHDARPTATSFASHYAKAARALAIEPVMMAHYEGAGMLQAIGNLPADRFQAAVLSWSPPETDEGAFVRLALARRLPLLGTSEGHVDAGCLVVYEAVGRQMAPRLASIAAKILDGADPAEMPFEFPLNFRLVINLRTAKALGITVPPEIMLRANRVIA